METTTTTITEATNNAKYLAEAIAGDWPDATGETNDMLAGEYAGYVIDGDQAFAYDHFERADNDVPGSQNRWVQVDLRTGEVTEHAA